MNLLFITKKITITSSVYLFLLISATWQSAIPVSAKENNINYHNQKLFTKQTQFSERINKKIEPLELKNTIVLASKVERKSTSEPQEPDIALFSLIILGSVVVWQKNNLHEIISTQVSRAISYYSPENREQTKKLQQQIDRLNRELIALSKQQADNESKHQEELKENKKYLSEQINDVYLQLDTFEQSKKCIEDIRSKYIILSKSLDYVKNSGVDFRIAIRQYNYEKQVKSEELFEKIDNVKQECGYMLDRLTDENYALESKLSQIDIMIAEISEKVDNKKQAESEELFEKIDNVKQECDYMLDRLTGENYALKSKLSQIDITIAEISEKVDHDKQAKSEELFEKIDNVKQECGYIIDQLTDENYTLESKLSQIDITIAEISEKVDHCITASAISEECLVISNPSTVLRVLEKVDRDFRILRIYNSARNSAKIANFNNYDRLYLAFQTIAEIGERYFDASHELVSLGNNIENEFKRRNFSNNYRPTESESTINKYGNQRIFSHGDESKQVFRHLTFSGSEHCLQIYFDFNKERKTVDICYCGNHLPIVSRSN